MQFLNPIFIISILIAISVHEWAHAVAATRLGDPTPGNAGRLTLNPLAHIDLLGAFLFLTVGFGWAKPVPINPLYFHKPKQGIFITSIAGPLSNFVLAFLCAVLLALFGPALGGSAWMLLDLPTRGSVVQVFILQLLASSLFINLGLMAFNLLPIAPLDGSKVLEAFIPRRYADQYEEFMRIGPWILLALLLGEHFFNVPLLSAWVIGIMEWVLGVFQSVVVLLT